MKKRFKILINQSNEFKNNKAAALCHLLKFKEQVQCYSKSIEINPNDLSIHFNKGNCLSFNLNKLFLVIKRLLN